VPRELLRRAALAAVLLTVVASADSAARAQTPGTIAGCPGGPDGRTEIVFQAKGGQCVVVEPVASVCVAPGAKIHWTLTNRDCEWKPGEPAVVLSQPRPKKGPKKGFAYADCVPKRDPWPAKSSVTLSCLVPADAEEGLYKYDVTGQVKTLDPDVEVRKGGGGGD
jgi:hypothetical protein